jgi:parallel beta-helix repeat protein
VNCPHVITKPCWTYALSAKFLTENYKLNFLIHVSIMSLFRYSIFLFAVSLGVALTGLLDASQNAALGQLPSTEIRNGEQPGVKTMSQVNVLFVNPSIGDDKVGNGGENAPFKTITQALQVAGSNTVIMLSKGTYSTETGEKFPLILKPNVSIQGDNRRKGRGIVIAGGGNYLSRTFGGQNVTIVGANQAGLTGVTLSNPNPRGYGLWIEYSNPLIVENTFTGSTQDGIIVIGNSSPVIRNNFFYENKANGITISGSSRPEVRENVFQQTGFGINIAQNSQPLIVGNQIQYNRVGVVVQAKARPILRNNLIQGSKEDGLVALALAVPNLGSAAEPGGNEFRNNTRHDINASAAKEIFPAFGNKINQNRIAGKVDFTGNVAIASGLGGEINFAGEQQSREAGVQNSDRLPLPLPRNNRIPTPTVQTGYQGQALPTRTILRQRASLPNRATQLPSRNSSESLQSNYTQISPDTIEFAAPQANSQVSNTILAPAPVQRARSQPASVRGLEAAPVGDSSATVYSATSVPSASAQEGINLRYRVIVEIQNEKDQELIKFLAPGAFRTLWRGRDVMQAGIFSTRYNADSMVNIFNNNGLRASIEPVN